MFYRARDVYEASNNMTTYPMVEPPRAPVKFSLWTRSDGIDLAWTPASGGPEITQWELFRTENWVDNLFVNGCLENASLKCGYEQIAILSPETTSYTDTNVLPDTEYFYYLQGVGQPQQVDASAINGTPDGSALRSGRYFTQTFSPMSASMEPEPGQKGPFSFALEGNYPNPVSRVTKILYVLPEEGEVELSLYDVLGRRVSVLVDGYKSVGRHEYLLKPTQLSNGVYFYVLRAGGQRAEGKMLILR